MSRQEKTTLRSVAGIRFAVRVDGVGLITGDGHPRERSAP